MIPLCLKDANLFWGSLMACLRNQKCTIYQNRIVTNEPQKDASDSYKALCMTCTAEIPVREGRLVYTPPASETMQPEKRSGSKKQQVSVKPSQTTSEATTQSAKKRGRPPDFKNKRTLEREALESSNGTTPKRGKDPPKGSKNQKTLEREAASISSYQQQ